MKRFLLLMVAILVWWGGATAQTLRITGKITSSEDGGSLPGATVVVKGTTIGATADFDGNYSLNLSPDAEILVFSYVGTKTQEVAIAGRSVIDIVLEPNATGLEEVVVTALGISTKEKNLGYSATKVSSDDLTKTSNRSALNALQGKVAGVNVSSASGQPGASSRVILRGLNSLGGANQPLYVVDGVPISNRVIGDRDYNNGMADLNDMLDFGNRANDLNPDDIESMTILKSAAGTSVYGSRAANGVIIITTKKGSDRGGKGAKIDFSTATTFESPLRITLMQNEFGQGWFDGTLEANLEENGSWGPKFDGKTRVWGHIIDNQQKIKPYKALEDNVKDFYERGVSLNNSLSITNGNEKTSYFLSFGNITADGILPGDNDSYKRNNVSIRGETKFRENLTVSGSFNYIKKNSTVVLSGQDQSVMDAIYQAPRDISVVDHKDYNNKFNNVDNYYSIYSQNPYYVLNEHGNKFGEERLLGNIGIDYQIAPWLKTTFRVGADVANSTVKSWRAVTLSTRATYNDEIGRVRESAFYNSELTTDLIISAKKTFFEKLDVNVTMVHNYNQRNLRDQWSQVLGLDIPGFYNLSNSSSTPTVSESTSKRRIVGAYGSMELTWNEYLTFSVSGRNDWSSTLPAKSRSFFYPSTSLSLLFSELLGDNLKQILPYGKIRASIAKAGNDAAPYQVLSVFRQANLGDGYRNLNFPLAGAINGFRLGNTIGNPELQPEITTEKEVGADLRFFNYRFNIDIAVYDKTITDLIWAATLPASTGYLAQTMNLGKITNKGIELNVSVSPIKTRDFEWKLNWNYTKNNNELVELIPGLNQIDLGGTTTNTFIARPGNPLSLFEGQVPATTPDGRIIVNEQGLPNGDPVRKVLGNSQYDYMMGTGTAISWKGLSMAVQFDIRQGGLMYSRTKEMQFFSGNAVQTTYNDRQPFIIPNSVQLVPGTTDTYVENTVPIDGPYGNMYQYYNQTYGAYMNNGFLIDKSFVKLRELSINYSLPKKLLSKTFIAEADISLIGRNLLLWTPSSNTFIDPEATTFGDSNGLEADFGEYGAIPSTRSYGFSIKLSF